MNIESTSFSGGDTQKSRHKMLLKKLTDNMPDKNSNTNNNNSVSVSKKKSTTITNNNNKTQTKSCIDQSDSNNSRQHRNSFSSQNSDDEELKKYVKEFKKKVEKKYTESVVNKNYKFQFVNRVFDSEESIQSLLDVEQYNLFEQNKGDDKDETEQ